MANWAKLQEDITGLPVVKRARHGIHFQNNDGSITANFSGKPCHYFEGGLWKPIDTKLLNTPDGWLGCAHSKVNIHPDGRVRIAGTDYAQRAELPSAQTGLVDGDKLIRKFAFGEQRMWVTEDGFKSEIQLNRIPTLTEAKKLIAKESGTLSKEYLKSLTSAEDAKGNTHTVTTLTAFRTWLASAVFPVVIDPDFSENPSINNYAFGVGTWAVARSQLDYENSSPQKYIKVGTYEYEPDKYYIYRAYMSFDTSSLGASSTITQVNMGLKHYGSKAAGYECTIVKHNFSSQSGDTKFDAVLTNTADDSPLVAADQSIVSNEMVTSGNLSTAWVNKTGITYYSFRHSADYSNTETHKTDYFYWYGSGYSTPSYRPVLTVTYTAASTAFVNILDHTKSVILGGSIVR